MMVVVVMVGAAGQIFSPVWKLEVGGTSPARCSDECGAAVENCSGLQWTAVTVTVVIMR